MQPEDPAPAAGLDPRARRRSRRSDPRPAHPRDAAEYHRRKSSRSTLPRGPARCRHLRRQSRRSHPHFRWSAVRESGLADLPAQSEYPARHHWFPRDRSRGTESVDLAPHRDLDRAFRLANAGGETGTENRPTLRTSICHRGAPAYSDSSSIEETAFIQIVDHVLEEKAARPAHRRRPLRLQSSRGRRVRLHRDPTSAPVLPGRADTR